jgi:hypothetical protein
MIHLLMLLAGAALAALNTWQRLGRSPAARRWARGTHRDFAQRNVLVLWPSLAVTLLGGAGLGAAERLDAPTWPFVVPVVVGLLTWLTFAALPLPVPSAVQPRWYRESAGLRG